MSRVRKTITAFTVEKFLEDRAITEGSIKISNKFLAKRITEVSGVNVTLITLGKVMKNLGFSKQEINNEGTYYFLSDVV